MPNKEVKTFCPFNAGEWRAWLQENHSKEKSVWLVFYKNKSKIKGVSWSEAVDEALCYGWIDSLVKPIDEEKFMRFFCRRKPKSIWSAINKDKVKQLIETKRMTPAGMECVDRAMEDGSWSLLDSAEALTIPQDLEQELDKWPIAKDFFLSLSRSNQKGLLQWLLMAKRAETRQKRIDEIVASTRQSIKPKFIR
ncbi:uncharacterized protein YdeI (YjbR/CyaY-like superfamily) [Dyadobacter jejuensis]|uniref:Uncharacterized protein YdeI (YjbR/CyaY-like superfamily) n=1 Tax=Dyadobacter jejuensis TaxID=1082580 RepID=A0A316AL75_9BACT|nr:YdeI/OmpD-associated family protein [Dyadobacter jejuensis]PWJ57600.1 uncharacterized protein YdeI (YjbR/CyaY-like superfamily) [Dyadobacter jejuensis]